MNASDLTHLTRAANPDPLQSAAAGCWRVEHGRLRLDAAAMRLFCAAEAELSLQHWLRHLPAADSAALATALDNAAAPLATFVTTGGRRLLLRGAWSEGAWQGLALALPECAAETAAPRAHDGFVAGVGQELRTGDERRDTARPQIEADQPLDLHALAARVGVFASGLRQGQPIRLYTVLDPDCPQHLHGDVLRIEQLLAHLTGHALQHTESGMVVLGAKVRERRDHQITLRLSVSRSGAGIGPDPLQSLGLADARRLLEAHGTQLQVAADEGGGTICWFDLTLALDPAAVPPTPVADTVVFSTDRRLAATVAAQWRAHGHALRNTAQAARARRWVVDAVLPEAGERIAQARRGGHDCIVVSAAPAPPGRPAVALPLLAATVFAHPRGHGIASDPRVTGAQAIAKG